MPLIYGNWNPPPSELVRRQIAGVVAADQCWYWKDRWLAGEAEAQADIDAGNLKHFDCED